MSKRFLLRKGRNKVVTVRGEQSYKTDLGEYTSVFKKGQTVSSIIQSEVPHGVMPNQAKLNDVKVLIEKHWGKEWHALENLQYYSEVLKKYDESPLVDSAEVEAGNLCEPVEEIPDLVV
ncbi:unnamed protein product [Acanthoscelides obtectus]|uniref:Uncharacterized protein n=1 Tax=Acanthoscelides obtectus TaxID=200917 RepID=A0A9P0LVW7_ACAOB|nr:unnamed protein product [Acanthoscelides obtectus]CAK1672165.1 hypothetical protein AOBTE_LOCUS28691 [Acanthoscelides obtectus]